MAILASKLENPHAALREHAQVAIPDGLDALVSRALAREPRDRFASAQELLKAWRGLSPSAMLEIPTSTRIRSTVDQDAPTLASPTAMDVAAGEPHPTQTALTAGTSIRRSSSSAKIAIVLAAFGLVAGIVVVGVAFTRAPPAADRAPLNAAPDTEPSASSAVLDIPLELADEGGVAAHEPPASFPATRARPWRKTAPARSAAPRASGPHITTQPRY
jgi:serine/threonine-protein kinase